MPTSSVLPVFLTLFLLVQGGLYKEQAGVYNLGIFGGQLPVKIIRVTNTVAVPVPVPFPVTKHVPFPVSIPKPIPYAVPQPIPIEVSKPVVIQQAVPVGIPKPYAVPQMFAFRQTSMSVPAGHLTVPQYQPEQMSDYQAYLSYGQGNTGIGYVNGNAGVSYDRGNEGNIYGNGNEGNTGYGNGNENSNDYLSTQGGYSQVNYNQDQSVMSQQGYGSVEQGLGGYSLQGNGGYADLTNGQGYQPTGQGYTMTEGSVYPAMEYRIMLGQNFESTNTVEDRGPNHGSY